MRSIVLGLAVLVAVSTPAAAETWNPFSRTANTAFLADSDSILVEGEVTRVQVATVPLRGAADDRSHTIETYEFQCATSKWRTAGMVEHGPDGAVLDRYPEEGATWEPVRPNTNPEYLKQIACDGARSNPPVWPTIAAFMDAGRPQSPS